MSAAEPTAEAAAALFDLLTHTLERRTRELSIGGAATLFTLWRSGPRRRRPSRRSRVSPRRR